MRLTAPFIVASCLNCLVEAARVPANWETLSLEGKAANLCSEKSMVYSEQAFQDSKASIHFRKFVEESKARNPGGENIAGISAWFGDGALGHPNFRCSILDHGCKELPSCDQVSMYVISTNPESPREQLLHITRWRYFTAYRMDDIVKLFYALKNHMDAIEQRALAISLEYSKTFFPQTDEGGEAKCKELEKNIGIVFSMLQAVLSAVQAALSAFTAGAIGQAQSVANDLIRTIAKPELTKLQEFAADSRGNGNSPGAQGGFSAAWAVLGTGISMSMTELKQSFLEKLKTHLHINPDASKWDGNKFNPDFPMAIIEGDVDWGCQRYLAGRDKMEAVNRAPFITAWVSDIFTSHRTAIENFTKDVTTGDGTAMIELLDNQSTRWRELTSLLQDGNQFEVVFSKVFEQQLMGFCLSSAHCYTKCQLFDSSKERDDLCDKSKAKRVDIRYCPASDLEVCQMQCQTALSSWNREVNVYGRKEIEESLGSMKNAVKVSRDTYMKKQHGKFEVPKEGTKLDAFLSFLPDGFSVPLCRGKHVTVTDYADGYKDPGLKSSRDQAFPCQCGGWNSDETEDFYTQLHLGKNSTTRTDKKYGEIDGICDAQIRGRNFGPAKELFALCAYGSNGAADKSIAHPVCDRIRAELAGKTEHDANRYLCGEATSAELARKELGYEGQCKKLRIIPGFDDPDSGLTEVVQAVTVIIEGPKPKNASELNDTGIPPSDIIDVAEDLRPVQVS